MFFRLLLFSSLIIVILQAQTDKIEILAKTLDKKGDIVHAVDDVVLYSDKYTITSDEAYYDYNTSDLELIGNITIMEGESLIVRSEYVKLNMKSDIGSLAPMFTYTGESKMWIKCNDAKFNDRHYTIKKSIFSSCNVKDPDWRLEFTTGKYDKQEQFLSTYNTLFYIKDIPMFYLPYFSFSTDNRRRSGLLQPQISLGADEGLSYTQPIYFAPQENWDLQINPQIRTNRGAGLHGTLRFSDSPYSSGEISAGKFEEKSSYMIDNDLKNDEHYGYGIKYDRSKLFSQYFGKNVEDGLWVDFNYLNDIDYLNTIDNEEKNYDSLVQSTINYYMNRDLDYYGLYFKYYIDTSYNAKNDEISQEIPTAHYHRFLNNIFKDNIFYSIDYKSKNFISKDGFDATTHQVDVPLAIYFPLLNDFLHFQATENINLTQSDYRKSNISGGGNAIQNFHKFSLHTELVKPYKNVFHTMYVGLDYIVSGYNKKSDDFKILEQTTTISELDSLFLNTRDNISIKLIEFLYNSDGKKIASHTLRQSILMDNLSNNEEKYQDLNNNINLYFNDNLTLGNLLNYSYEFDRFSKFQTLLLWESEDYRTSFIHTYQQDSNDDIDDYLTFSIDTDYIKNYNLFTSINYDMEDEYLKSWQVGWTMKKKCWDYRLAYREEIEPNSSSSGSTIKQGVYFMFNLYPLGGISYDFTQDIENG
ncbi:MAG: LPS-assembly protein LptD [Sulfurospirillum sp.]|nr:LPS-assembly protein LptD [Sulfurospirillum sp.]MBL0703537.1 LPS-assembly protein LptD [Sulfurospirillum sp.]